MPVGVIRENDFDEPQLSRNGELVAGTGDRLLLISGSRQCTVHALELILLKLIKEGVAPTAEPRTYSTTKANIASGSHCMAEKLLSAQLCPASCGVCRAVCLCVSIPCASCSFSVTAKLAWRRAVSAAFEQLAVEHSSTADASVGDAAATPCHSRDQR